MTAQRAIRFPAAAAALLIAVFVSPAASAQEPFGLLHDSVWKVMPRQGPDIIVSLFDRRVLKKAKISCEQILSKKRYKRLSYPEARSMVVGSIWSRPTAPKYQPDYMNFQRSDVEARAGRRFLANGAATAQKGSGDLCMKGKTTAAVCYCVGWTPQKK
ncbi:hypothetical protein [Oricola sp.]|uniref:hypothetical protein n=1 Tax=Oricola sp. TaxID=1979950 RepID=UPI0025E6E0C9|nr:hypothetical protein [Oricola sp.]MCI5078429.1 hypothetical protein [Oricola sp.]